MLNTQYEIVHFIETVLSEHRWSVATAESCTGGCVAAALTAMPGSSACVKGGVVAYTEEMKMQLLDVSENTLRIYGVVSEQVVVEMAKGVMKAMNSDFSVATTGVAGPSGGTKDVPVGTIWLAVASRSSVHTYCIRDFDKGREQNTRNAVLVALELLKKIVKNEENQS